MGEEFRSEEGAEGVASRSGVRAPERPHGMIRNVSLGCGGGAKSKGALYRETLQTTGFYVGRIVIVTREFTPIPAHPTPVPRAPRAVAPGRHRPHTTTGSAWSPPDSPEGSIVQRDRSEEHTSELQ